MTTTPTPVLLVDDQPLVAAAVRRLFAPATDLVLHYCPDPARAEAEAEAVGAGLLIVDLVMPGIGGLEFVRRLRGKPATAGLPVVVLSAHEDPRTKAEALDAGADDYLVKLPDGVELLARLRALLRRTRR
jgi:two-component system chemotaxis family response regulator WspR